MKGPLLVRSNKYFQHFQEIQWTNFENCHTKLWSWVNWIRTNFFHEVRWYKEHPICKFSSIILHPELIAHVLPPLKTGMIKDLKWTKRVHLRSFCIKWKPRKYLYKLCFGLILVILVHQEDALGWLQNGLYMRLKCPNFLVLFWVFFGNHFNLAVKVQNDPTSPQLKLFMVVFKIHTSILLEITEN